MHEQDEGPPARGFYTGCLGVACDTRAHTRAHGCSLLGPGLSVLRVQLAFS